MLFFGCSQALKTPLEELTSIGEQMKQQEQVSYAYQMKMYRSYRADTIFSEGITYFEQNPSDTSIGYNFSQESEYHSSFYNGKYVIDMFHADSSALKGPLNKFKNGHGSIKPYLEMSYAAIKNFLTDSLFTTLVDSIVKTDTVIGNEPCFSYTFWIDARVVDTYKIPQYYGNKKINLIIRERDFQPMYYSQYQIFKSNNSHFHEAHFKDYSFRKMHPKHQFSIENLPEYYRWDKIANLQTLELQSDAPDWELPVVSGDKLNLSDLRGKYVLLDFWFIGCGACLQSIPSLNTLQSKYKHNDLEVIGVNCYSNNEDKIEAYCTNRGMHYRNVWKGKRITDEYRIEAAPIFYLIDKEGKIAYTQIGHNEKLLFDNVEKIINLAH